MNKNNLKKLCCVIVTILICFAPVADMYADNVQEPDNLYARSCVLMDGSTGRILFEKNGYEKMPMASTTKIMTLIVALENTTPDDMVTVSAYAASQPKVHLGMHQGQQFTLKDLCYSLMLESHNDSAVAIAEYVGSKKLNLPKPELRSKEESKKAVLAFTAMMNEKARDIGCYDTFFITPNGLDATAILKNGEKQIHSTTARDLATILMYCINTSVEKEQFLSITRTDSHTFQDVEGKSSYHCSNHNAFLKMMDGALTGKTGFTNQAGYCYVGALYRDHKLFIVSLLACGWPNNRSYKWSDTKKLMEYGLEVYQYKQLYDPNPKLSSIPVTNAKTELGKKATITPIMKAEQLDVLVKEGERLGINYDLPKQLPAPVKKGDIIGQATYSVSGETIAVYPVYAGNTVDRQNFLHVFRQVVKIFFGNF